MPNILRALLVAALAVVIVRPAWAQAQAATDGLKPGDVLDKTNWQKAEGLLPPEILKHYQNGEYANAIVDWPAGADRVAARFSRRHGEECRAVRRR